MGKSTISYYFYGHFQQQTGCLPEGNGFFMFLKNPLIEKLISTAQIQDIQDRAWKTSSYFQATSANIV